jgi:hypothetical protein
MLRNPSWLGAPKEHHEIPVLEVPLSVSNQAFYTQYPGSRDCRKSFIVPMHSTGLIKFRFGNLISPIYIPRLVSHLLNLSLLWLY